MKNPIDNLYLSQHNFYNLIIVAIVLSMGINIIVSNLVCSIYWGIALVCGAILFLTYREIQSSRITKKIDAVILFDQKEHKLVKIPNYEFSRDVCDFLNAAIAESSDIKGLWKLSPIGVVPLPKSKTELEVKPAKTNSLITQLVEYIILDKLSLTNEAYFHNLELDDNKILTRKDINDYVATNQFVEIFSKPTSERAIFDNEWNDDNVYCVFGKNNAFYKKFELIIPNECMLRRGSHNTVSSTTVLSHPFFTLEITPEFIGYNANLPTNFQNMYLGILDKDYIDGIQCFSVTITIEFIPTFLSFWFLRRQYYQWIDRYISCMEDYASFDSFLKKIQWDNINAIICCKKHITK